MSSEIIVLAFALLVVLLIAGVPLGFSTGAIGAALLWINFGPAGLSLIAQRIYDLAVTFSLLAVPLFIFMSMLLERSAIAHRMYDALNLLLCRIRGGVAVTTAGIVTVSSASRIATRHAAFLSPHAIFICVAGLAINANDCASLPVPAVVGTAISGFKGPGTGKPWPIGAFT